MVPQHAFFTLHVCALVCVGSLEELVGLLGVHGVHLQELAHSIRQVLFALPLLRAGMHACMLSSAVVKLPRDLAMQGGSRHAIRATATDVACRRARVEGMMGVGLTSSSSGVRTFSVCLVSRCSCCASCGGPSFLNTVDIKPYTTAPPRAMAGTDGSQDGLGTLAHMTASTVDK